MSKSKNYEYCLDQLRGYSKVAIMMGKEDYDIYVDPTPAMKAMWKILEENKDDFEKCRSEIVALKEADYENFVHKNGRSYLSENIWDGIIEILDEFNWEEDNKNGKE